MRNEALIGYLLHQRPYQEKRALYYFFSKEQGIVHGIGKKGAPLFVPIQLFATGKRDLKTFSQINIAAMDKETTTGSVTDSQSNQLNLKNTKAGTSERSKEQLFYQQISGQQQYAALYLNEILLKLLPTEDPMPVLWQHYQNSLNQLKQSLSPIELRLCLRRFERYLFDELGFALTLTHDVDGIEVIANTHYRFSPDVGLVAFYNDDESLDSSQQGVFAGRDIIQMIESGVIDTTAALWSRLHRRLIDHLLDYQPLQSRLLWQQQQRYQ